MRAARARVGDVIRKFWALPTTALGLGYGTSMHVLGKLAGRNPRIYLRDNAVQFTGGLNPGGAITLGNTTTWLDDPYDPNDRTWHDEQGRPKREPDKAGQPYPEGAGHTYPEHEKQHTYQAEQLGPLYLPSNILGGLSGLLFDRKWHGPHNWNETGPQRERPEAW